MVLRGYSRIENGMGDKRCYLGIGVIWKDVPESLVLWPCFAALELSSRSACLAAWRGSEGVLQFDILNALFVDV